MLWSILIAAIPERFHAAQPLLYSLLENQSVARIPDIELIYTMDNKRRPVGAKRNALLDTARGEYISWIDDDDEVASDYVSRIHNAIIRARKTDPQPDVICFKQRATIMPQNIIHECSYSLDHWRRPPEQRRQLAMTDKPNVLAWTGPPAHTMVWRREAVAELRFTEKQLGEDVDWCDAACERAKTEMQLDATLYYYKFDAAGSATRG